MNFSKKVMSRDSDLLTLVIHLFFATDVPILFIFLPFRVLDAYVTGRFGIAPKIYYLEVKIARFLPLLKSDYVNYLGRFPEIAVVCGRFGLKGVF